MVRRRKGFINLNKEGSMKEQPNIRQKSEQEEAQDFIAEYQKLCNKHGFNIVITPAYRARDDGTWSTVLQTSVGRLPKNTA